MKRTLLVSFAVLMLTAAGEGVAQQACPCVPLSYQWIATPCESWNCAAAATVLANGDRFVLAVPTGSDDFKWVVLKRIVSGAAVVDPNAPYRVEAFDTVEAATTRFTLIDQQLKPMVMSVPDGRFVIVARSAAERRRPSTH